MRNKLAVLWMRERVNLWGLGSSWVPLPVTWRGPVKFYLQISAFCEGEMLPIVYAFVIKS
jgi:hypothetical protein